NVPPQFLNRLATFPLFNKAPKSFHSRVASKLTLVQFHPQEFIIKRGDPSKSMYWILKGTVSVASTDGESVYAELAAGSFFGEIGILFNRPRTATVVARTKVLVGVLTSEALNTVLKHYPSIERRIRDEAQERLAMQDKKKKYDLPNLIAKTNNNNNQHLIDLPSPQESLSTADNVDASVSIQDFIKSLPVFQKMPASIIHQVALDVEPFNVKPFEYIFHKGDTDSDIYFIINGEVEVIDHITDSKSGKLSEIVLARLQAGSYFGEMSFLSFLDESQTVTRSKSIRSVSSVELMVVRTDNLKRICSKYPYFVEEMKETARERNRLNHQKEAKEMEDSRLSINYLINTDRRTDSNIKQPQPKSRLSPLILDTVVPHPASLPSLSSIDSSIQKKRKASIVSSKGQIDEHLPQLTIPSLNPVVPSLNNFQNFQFNYNPSASSNRSMFQYLPHNKRMRLASVSNGRRRSSILSHNGRLPDRILLKIFEFLPLPTLMKLRILNKRWRQLLYAAPNIFQTLDLTPWNTSIDDEALIRICDFVGSRPQVVDISNCFHITDEGFSYMVNEIGIAGKIKVLRMKSNWEVSAMSIMDLTVPSVGQHLEEIDLSNCRKVRDNVLERLIGWDSENNLEEVVQNHPGDFDTDQIGCKNLKILNVGYCKHLTDNFMYHIANHANRRLESLDLTRCTTITDTGFQYWTYRSFPTLKKLSLKDCTFLTDKAIISIANAATNLEILDLNFCCALSNIAIEVLCLGCPNIRELDLSFCGSAVSDSSLVAISLNLRKLEKLILTGCIRVTRAGVDALLSGCSSLNYLNISQCKNAHIYPGRIPAQKLNVNHQTKSAFVTAGPFQNVIEIVI
ncbi:RNI-like protein, partial [Suhomyces tanzawaensis NRRL Y-17324]